MSSRTTDFQLADLYAALDAQRRQRNLSWSEAVRQIAGSGGAATRRRLSLSTILATRSARVSEADGVLQMLLWLGRSPESFSPEHPTWRERSRPLPSVPPGKVLRFDTRAIHKAVNEQRSTRGLTWAETAAHLGLGVSTLRHLAAGGRTAFPQVMRITAWLGRPAADFTRAADV